MIGTIGTIVTGVHKDYEASDGSAPLGLSEGVVRWYGVE
jgi:hypothetical protein